MACPYCEQLKREYGELQSQAESSRKRQAHISNTLSRHLAGEHSVA